MKNTITADYHVHTDFSCDSDEPMENCVMSAIGKGLTEIALTDHVDYPSASLPPQTGMPERYYEQVMLLKDKYADKIKIALGVEMGIDKGFENLTEKHAKDWPFDFIIGSLHDIDGAGVFEGDLIGAFTPERAIEVYLSRVLYTVSHNDCFCVYGHLDYIQRYVGAQVVYHEHAEIIDTILRTLIENGKGIEVNASGYRDRPYPYPHKDILKRYRELGGEILTIGSDAHRAENIGVRFGDIHRLLSDLSFKYYTTYNKKQPVMNRL